MNYYVIGDDKSLERAFTASDINYKLELIDTIINGNTSAITQLQQSAGTVQKRITSGTAAPSGGANGDIYIQY